MLKGRMPKAGAILAWSLFFGASLAYGAKSSYSADSHTVALWNFDEGKGSEVSDASKHGHRGTAYGATWSQDGISGSCLQFDGLDDYLEVSSSPKLVPAKALTLEAWLLLRPGPGSFRRFAVLSKADNYRSENGYLWEIESDGCPKHFMNVTGWVKSSRRMPVNIWCYLAITYDGKCVRYYINGAQTDSFPANQPKVLGNDFNAIIGRTYNTKTYFFRGLMDEIRISDKARSSAEIAKVWEELGKKAGEVYDFTLLFQNGERINCRIAEPREMPVETRFGRLAIPFGELKRFDRNFQERGEDLVLAGNLKVYGQAVDLKLKINSKFGELEVKLQDILGIERLDTPSPIFDRDQSQPEYEE